MAKYVTNPCVICGKPATVISSQVKRGRGKTCSRECGMKLTQKAKWEKYYAKFDEIFWSRVDVQANEECWPWMGNSYPEGYGRFKQDRRQVLAHRYALASKKGHPTEPNLLALHSCDNPICCNPSHLRWGTPKENMQDCLERGRFGGATRKIAVTEMLALKAGGASNTAISRHFGVHPSSVARATLRALVQKGGME